MKNDLFEKAPIHKAYFTFALPVVFSMVISLVYNMVDTYFITQTGNTNLVAGVSLVAPVFTLMIALGDIFGLGGSSMISRLLGEKRDDDGRRISSYCFYAALILGLVVMVSMLLFRGPILHLLGATKSTYEYASQYYTWLVIGSPLIILALTPSNLLRTEGLAKLSMIGTVSGSIVNIILDPIFISTLGLGAAGAAIATVIGNVCTDIILIWATAKKSNKLSMNPTIISIDRSEILQLLAIGIPASITNLMQSFGITITNRFLLPYGTKRIAAMGVAMKVNMIAVLILVGFAFGGQPLIGYNYGAKNKKRLREVLRFSYVFECSLGIVLTLVLWLAAPVLIRFFMDDPAIIHAGTMMLRFQLISMVCISVVLVTTCTFQSTGKALGAFLLSVSRQGVIFAIVLVIASECAGYYGVISAQAIADLFTAVMGIILFQGMLRKELRRENNPGIKEI